MQGLCITRECTTKERNFGTYEAGRRFLLSLFRVRVLLNKVYRCMENKGNQPKSSYLDVLRSLSLNRVTLYGVYTLY